MKAANQFGTPLRLEANPFAADPAKPYLSAALQTAFRKILYHIVLRTPTILVIGAASTGKTLLAELAAQTCSDMGLFVRQAGRGDLVKPAQGERSDVLLVDEANAIDDATLQALSSDEERHATTTVFLGLPISVNRFVLANIHPVIIELTPFAPSDAQSYLLGCAARAGLPGLFAPGALDRIIEQSQGSPRLLRSAASLAFFTAASGGASQIQMAHVGSALEGQIPPGAQKTATPVLRNVAKSQASNFPETPQAPGKLTERIWSHLADEAAEENRIGTQRARTVGDWREYLEDLIDGSWGGRGFWAAAAVAVVILAGVTIASMLERPDAASSASLSMAQAPAPAIAASIQAPVLPAVPPPVSDLAEPSETILLPEGEARNRSTPQIANPIDVRTIPLPVEKPKAISILAEPSETAPPSDAEVPNRSTPETANPLDARTIPLPIEKPRAISRVRMSDEEAAAIARGIQELENAADRIAPGQR